MAIHSVAIAVEMLPYLYHIKTNGNAINNTTQGTYIRVRIDAATKERTVEALVDMGLAVFDTIGCCLSV